MASAKIVNGWTLYQTALFRAQLVDLMNNVKQLKQERPETYLQHPKTKLLASIFELIYERIPADPGAREYDATRELGEFYRSWRRAKKGMPDRYRLFFKFDSSRKVIVYWWFNDEDSLRKAGSKTDVYEVFKRHIAQGTLPDSLEAAIAEAAKPHKGTDAAPDG